MPEPKPKKPDALLQIIWKMKGKIPEEKIALIKRLYRVDESKLADLKKMFEEQRLATIATRERVFKERQDDMTRKLHEAAHVRGGYFRSREYSGYNKIYEWECKKGHTWEASPAKILSQGKWCKECELQDEAEKMSNPKFLEDMIKQCNEIASSKGGYFRSKEFLGMKVKHDWECTKGHKFTNTPNAVINNRRWCRACENESLRASIQERNERKMIEECRKTAKAKGGYFRSKEWLGFSVNHQWECDKGHNFFAKPKDVLDKDKWCPNCSGFRMEHFSRSILEKAFGVPFPNTSPSWLRFRGRKFILDGYNDGLKLAFEYNGEQHYRFTAHWHKSEKAFLKQEVRDEIVSRVCKKRGVDLIIVPFWVKKEDLPKYLHEECLKLGRKINQSKFYS